MSSNQQPVRSEKKRENSFVVEVGKDRSLQGYVVARKDLGRVKLDKLRIPAGANVVIVAATIRPNQKLPKTSRGSFYPIRVLGHFKEGTFEPSAPEVSKDAFQPGARAKALLQGTKLVEEDLRASGGAFSLEDVRKLMHGVSRQAVHKRVNEGSLLAVPGPSNRSMYPVVQFRNDGMPTEGLKEVRQALQTKSPWMLLNFLVSKEPRLGGKKPVDLLKAGEVESVVEVARRVGVQGA